MAADLIAQVRVIVLDGESTATIGKIQKFICSLPIDTPGVVREYILGQFRMWDMFQPAQSELVHLIGTEALLQNVVPMPGEKCVLYGTSLIHSKCNTLITMERNK